ncbi:unnamed protein product [Vitrella brassicaformis CCMP3155]|uniref:Peptidase C1A papain C-terminal domain-containing protein n=1 Tax=Vitrella brassicaformis (strain CCMP3155) TaxID=1169540 RepID=A0A0G4ETS0_VITBC|nr:unnamed protein product [Vitrella brassicaformis CCMP3155]|eukprot:CEM02021.1 unnamed protein product [Vitrella brassicaformis CCMP3155]
MRRLVLLLLSLSTCRLSLSETALSDHLATIAGVQPASDCPSPTTWFPRPPRPPASPPTQKRTAKEPEANGEWIPIGRSNATATETPAAAAEESDETQWAAGKEELVERLLVEAMNELTLIKTADEGRAGRAARISRESYSIVDVKHCNKGREVALTDKDKKRLKKIGEVAVATDNGLQIALSKSGFGKSTDAAGGASMAPLLYLHFREIRVFTQTTKRGPLHSRTVFRYDRDKSHPTVADLGVNVVDQERAISTTSTLVQDAVKQLRVYFQSLACASCPNTVFSIDDDDIFAAFARMIPGGFRVRLDFQLRGKGSGCKGADGEDKTASYHRVWVEMTHNDNDKGEANKREAVFDFGWECGEGGVCRVMEGKQTIAKFKTQATDPQKRAGEFFCQPVVPHTNGVCRHLYPHQSPKDFYRTTNADMGSFIDLAAGIKESLSSGVERVSPTDARFCAYDADIPLEFDPREDEKVKTCFPDNIVKNQGTCGSCWAFASSFSYADRQCLHELRSGVEPSVMFDGNRHTFSPQDLISCVPGSGCNSGVPAAAFTYY